MSFIATTACLGSALASTLAASSGPLLAVTGFFAGGTLGAVLGALAVMVFGLRGASA